MRSQWKRRVQRKVASYELLNTVEPKLLTFVLLTSVQYESYINIWTTFWSTTEPLHGHELNLPIYTDP